MLQFGVYNAYDDDISSYYVYAMISITNKDVIIGYMPNHIVFLPFLPEMIGKNSRNIKCQCLETKMCATNLELLLCVTRKTNRLTWHTWIYVYFSEMNCRCGHIHIFVFWSCTLGSDVKLLILNVLISNFSCQWQHINVFIAKGI
jgi:hypothetical protein